MVHTGWTAPGSSGYPCAMYRYTAFAALPLSVLLMGCGTNLPDLDSRLTDASRTESYPTLVPLGSMLAEVDAILPRAAAPEGENLVARAADLRRRAAELRRMPIS